MHVSRIAERPDSVSARVQNRFKETARPDAAASFQKAAFGDGATPADAAERWSRIQRGLAAIRGGEAPRPAVLKAQSGADPAKPAAAKFLDDAQETGDAPAVAPEVLAPARRTVARAEVLTRADAAGSSAADHWMKMRQAMRSGLLEKVEISTVTAQGGESLADLAAAHMGDPRKARILAKFNNLPLEGALETGTRVRIPTGGIIDRLRMHEVKDDEAGALPVAARAPRRAKEHPAAVASAPAARKDRPAPATAHAAIEPHAAPARDMAETSAGRPIDRIEMMIRQVRPVKI